MNLKITHAEVWTAEIDDQPGGLARTLRAVADYGADLDYVVAQRQPSNAGKGVLFLSPLAGAEQIDNASQAGLHRAVDRPALRMEGTDSPGAGSRIARIIGDAGVSMNSMSAAVVGRKFVCYATFDSEEDRRKAEAALQPLTKPHWQFWPHHTEKVA